MPLILAIETATKLCSVAVGRDGQVLALREVDDAQLRHAERLNVFVDEVMREAGLPLSALDAVAVGTGPGSYTGLRIGLSAAKGFCYALQRPIIGIPTLAVLVAAARTRGSALSGTLWPMIDARRMEVFTQPYATHGTTTGDVAPLILDEAWAASAEQPVVFGDGADKAAALWRSATHITHVPGIVPSARHMIGLAEQRFAAGAFDDLAYLVPAYGKAANVTQPARKG
ncbi:MAG: tRNA (adenosine(37)-N6)-threonylcarbamoyltransferase complex dimerization subunit type 1 TsaB [Flavobacteriales bacterium]